MKPSPSQLAILRPDFSATAELTWPELGTLGESEERAPGALKDAPTGRRTLGAPGLRQSAASCGRSAQHRPRLGGRTCCPLPRRRWRERSPPTLAFPPRQPDRSAKGSSTLSLRTAPVPEKWKEGDVFVVTLPQILTQVHKAHDHVCVVEKGAVLSAGHWGRAAASRSRGQKALAVQGVRSSRGRLPELGRAGPSAAPGLPPLLVRCPVFVVVVGQGVVQIQHEERRGLQPSGRGLPASLLLLEHRELRLLEAVQGPGPVRKPQHGEDLLLHLPLLVRLEPAVEEARGGGQRRLLRLGAGPAVPQQRPPARGGGGGGQGRQQWRGPAAATQQPPPPAQPLRPPPQSRHPRPAGLAPWAPRGVEQRSEAGAPPLWPLA